MADIDGGHDLHKGTENLFPSIVLTALRKPYPKDNKKLKHFKWDDGEPIRVSKLDYERLKRFILNTNMPMRSHIVTVWEDEEANKIRFQYRMGEVEDLPRHRREMQ